MIVQRSLKEVSVANVEEPAAAAAASSAAPLAADDDASPIIHFSHALYLDVGGEQGGMVDKFKFLKHNQVPNCTLELRRVVQSDEIAASSASAAAEYSESTVTSAAAAPPFLLCLVALRRIAPGTSFSVDFSQRSVQIFTHPFEIALTILCWDHAFPNIFTTPQAHTCFAWHRSNERVQGSRHCGGQCNLRFRVTCDV